MSKNKNIINELESLDSIEKANLSISENLGLPIQISKDLINKRKGAMHDASRLQMLATWARSTEEAVLNFHASNILDVVLSDLGSYAPGLAVIRLASGIKVGEDLVSRRQALRSATTKMLNTDAGNLNSIIRGRTIDLSCVSGVNVQYLKPLFSARDQLAVHDKAGMNKLLSQLFEIINRKDLELIPKSFIEACSIFARELFLNTQEHATSDRFGVSYDAHVEGMIVSWDEMESRFYKRDFQGHRRLRAFWNREKVSIRELDGIRCLQLSFFDTGPGFASRISGKGVSELSLDEERESLAKCFLKNVTTKNQSGSGGGLPLVLKELQRLGGLIRIRSGRLSLFNCFDIDDEGDILAFDDWDVGPFSSVCGAVVSILVPLRRG